MDLLSPDYNICTNPVKPGSSLGLKRSIEIKPLVEWFISKKQI